MRNVTPIWNPYQETTRKIWIGMEFVWLSHPHSFPILCLMWTFQPMYFPYCGNEQKITPYQCHTTIWPSHISATYGSHMAQTLPYLSHSFALVRVSTIYTYDETNLPWYCTFLQITVLWFSTFHQFCTALLYFI